MCLHSGRHSKTGAASRLQSGRHSYTGSNGLISGRHSLTSVENVFLVSGRHSKTQANSQLIHDYFVSPNYTQVQSNISSGSWTQGMVYGLSGSPLTQVDAPVIVPHVVLKDGTDLSKWLISLDFESNLGGKSSFTAVFVQGTASDNTIAMVPSDLNPLYYGTGSYSNRIMHHMYDDSRQMIITFDVWINGHMQTATMPPMALGAPRFDGEKLEWSGEDLTCLLEKEGQTRPDIHPDDPTVFMAHKTIKDICKSFGIKDVKLNFPDYRIRQLRMSTGTPLSWIEQITKIYQAQRRWEGNTLVWTKIDAEKAAPSYKLNSLNIDEAGCTLDYNTDWKNKFTITRLESNGGGYGRQDCLGTSCPGRTIKITLSEPLNSVDVMAKVIGQCTLGDWVYFDESDRPIFQGPQPPYYRGGLKCARLEGTCFPTFSGNQNTLSGAGGTAVSISSGAQNGVNIVGYNITVTGGVSTSSSYSDHYTYTMTDAASVVKYGELPDYENIEDGIIPTAAVAQAYLKAIIAENIRKIWKINLTSSYVNPFINVGDGIGVTDMLTRQSNLLWIVDKLSFHYAENSFWDMNIEGQRGLIP